MERPENSREDSSQLMARREFETALKQQVEQPLGEETQQTSEHHDPENQLKGEIRSELHDDTASSIKCRDCDTLFKNTEMAEWHAHKTGHINFEESREEIKPLTEEEKKIKLEKLRLLIQERREERQKKEDQERRQREIQMREEAKKMHKVREDLKDQELKKELEEQKRKKKDDLAYKASLRAKIEADKRERASKKLGFSIESPPPERAVPLPRPVTADYDESRLQIRLIDGRVLMQTFQAEDTLKSVHEFVRRHQEDDTRPFSLITTFPRKVYSENDINKTLKQLDLTPSATLILERT